MTATVRRLDSNPFAAYGSALDQTYSIANEYLAGLSDRPVSQTPTADAMAAALDEPFPEFGIDAADAVAEWWHRAEIGVVASNGPRFFGFVNGGSTPAALAGDWLASAIDQNAGLWISSPAASQTELTVLRWLKDLFGLPSEWAGGLTTGATMANFVGLAAGRQWVGNRMGFDPASDGLGGNPPIPVLSSEQIHASARKALAMLGLGRSSVRTVPSIGGRVDVDKLAAELASIDGPAIVVGTGAEVNTGAFDDLNAIADLCTEHPGGAWFHVDAAFGLFAAASPKYSHHLAGIERADSVIADAHKWLNVPYDCGFAFVRDADALRAAFSMSGAYIAPQPGDGWDPHTHVPEASRRFRALAAWCALKAAGRTGYREIVERCCDNAAKFAAWVESEANLELMAPAPLNIVCFRYVPTGLSDVDTDAFNRAAIRAIQADGRVFVTGTVWSGRAAIRAAFDHWATTVEDVQILEQTVADIGRQLVAG